MPLLGMLTAGLALAVLGVLAALLVPADLRAWRSGHRVTAAASLVLKALAVALVLGNLAYLAVSRPETLAFVTTGHGEALAALVAVVGIEASAVLVPALVLDAAVLLRSRRQD